MADTLSKEARSALMSRIRGKDTKPEIVVRRTLHSLGYRYRLHAKELPGSPDIVMRPRKKAIFVHGCFWHAHEGCGIARIPKTRAEFWENKFGRNRARDLRNTRMLVDEGWRVLTIWECQTRKGIDALPAVLRSFVEDVQ